MKTQNNEDASAMGFADLQGKVSSFVDVVSETRAAQGRPRL